MPRRRSTTKGFKRSGALLGAQIRKASETRGFAVSRVVTHWPEIVGEDLAAICRPVKVGYSRHGGLGATLSVLTTGAQAPMLEMQKEAIREKVNAAYGYNAIARVAITQTAATGFAEGQASFEYGKAPVEKPAPLPESVAEASKLAQPVGDAGLRAALERLGQNVLTKTHITKSQR